VIRGGENIPVSEIESLILRHPLVDEVAIIGVPDERLGERACAVVSSPSTGLNLSDLSDFLEELGTAKQFWPEQMVLVSEMPRTPSGKIQKFKLRQYLDGPAPT
jgi:non-ribosomal peptide synthetase component E (peptide arylation enzyme)